MILDFCSCVSYQAENSMFFSIYLEMADDGVFGVLLAPFVEEKGG